MVRSGGFTLLELLACCAVAAATLGIGAIRLPPMVATVRLSGAAHRLAAALRDARGRALARNVRIDVQFDPTRGAWDVRDTSGRTLETQALPPGVVFASVPASRRVRFTTVGTADNATVALSAGRTTRRIVVNQRGRVRVQ